MVCYAAGCINVVTSTYVQAAITEGMVAPDHFTKLSQRLEQQLQMEVYKDALAEVSLIRHNVVQAFLESSGDPTVVHNMIQMVRLDWAVVNS